jgi:hypothetical protein
VNGIVALIEKIVSSTPNTLRTLLIALLLIAAVVGGLWLLRANLSVGPVSITGREPAAAPRQPCPATSPSAAVVEEASSACGR